MNPYFSSGVFSPEHTGKKSLNEKSNRLTWTWPPLTEARGSISVAQRRREPNVRFVFSLECAHIHSLSPGVSIKKANSYFFDEGYLPRATIVENNAVALVAKRRGCKCLTVPGVN